MVALVDSIGNAINAYTYDVWGTPDPANTREQVDNPYRYAGYRWDVETGLYCLNARYYDQGLGRFLTRDA